MRPPLPYDPADAAPEPGEEATTRALVETFHGIQRKLLDDSGHAERAVHAKSYGLLEARLEVLPYLPIGDPRRRGARPRAPRAPSPAG